MNPKLKYFFVSRFAIVDSITRETSAIGIFEVIFLPETIPYVYSFSVIGRVELGTTGIVDTTIRIRLLDPAGKELRVVETSGSKLNAEYGISFSPSFFLVPFSEAGKYLLEVSVNVNGGTFVKVGDPYGFTAIKSAK